MFSWKMVIFILMALVVAACDNESDPTPAPVVNNVATSTPTAPIVVTRVITRTPVPTATPSPVPTLDMTLAGVEGTWTLLMRYKISDHVELGDVVYSASGALTVNFDSTITGEATFTPTVTYRDCPVMMLYDQPLTYQISGTLQRADDTQFTANLTLTPADPALVERYQIGCFEAGSATPVQREVAAPVLQRALEATNLLNLSLELALTGTTRTDSHDLNILTGGSVTGTMTSEVYVGR